MKIDYDQIMNTLEGEPFRNQAGAPLSLGMVIIVACSTPLATDEHMPPLDKYKVGEIAICVHKKLDLASEQITVAKDRIARVFTNPILVYLAHNMIEGR